MIFIVCFCHLFIILGFKVFYWFDITHIDEFTQSQPVSRMGRFMKCIVNDFEMFIDNKILCAVLT